MALMEPFTLSLSGDRQITGLYTLPGQPSRYRKAQPLVVTIHGGTFTASYYDADYTHSIKNISDALQVPVISLTRPGYGKSTDIPPLQEGQALIPEIAKYLHEVGLPEVWAKYGKSSGASSIVFHSHSVGAAVGIVCAALHNREPKKAGYPLSGLVTSGIGARGRAVPADAPTADKNPALEAIDNFRIGVDKPTMRTWIPKDKDALMLHPQDGLCSPDILKQTETLNHEVTILEAADMRQKWPHYWRTYAQDIFVPHLYAVGDADDFWRSEKQYVDEYRSAFPRSLRMEAGLLPKAPHCIELSYMGQGWLARSFGFAMECAVWDVLQNGDSRSAG